MAKKGADWGDAISKQFEKQREKDAMLSPNKGEMRYIADIARSMDKTAQLMDNASEMAHQGLIEFELAQRIMDVQKDKIKRDMKMLETYLAD